MDTIRVDELQVDSHAVFVRVDFNVPISDGRVTDSTRIEASLPTIRHLRERGAKVILASHLGRPKGKRDLTASLRPVAAALAETLSADVQFVEDCVGDDAVGTTAALRDGQVALLENLRFHDGEEKNDSEFAKQLARHARIYVNDAFGSSHRAHASIVGITEHVDEVAAGFLLGRELRGLRRAIERPSKPFVLIVGGAKVKDKIGIIEGLIAQLDHLLIGGAMAYTFLRVGGLEVGRSRVEEDQLETAARVLELAEKHGVEVSLPVDHVVAPSMDAEASARTVESDLFPSDVMGLDIGPITCLRYSEIIDEARTIIWNGPMGVFERPAFAHGTMQVARAISTSLAYSVVGGGDSAAAVQAAGVADRIGHLSTGGGASLEYLAGRTLPGLMALTRTR